MALSLSSSLFLLYLLLACKFNDHHFLPVSSLPLLQNETNDQLTLLLIKSTLLDPFGALASWSNNSIHYCDWYGVTCHKQHTKRVWALDLRSLGLTGFISPHIEDLTFLHRVDLADNQLHGFIPQELGFLTRLTYLNLTSNSLEGEIPPSLSQCLNLQVLHLESNNLTGEIPRDFGSLPKLEVFILRNNELVGIIPPLLGKNSSCVTYVDLSYNSITGGIPLFLGNSSLEYIDLSYNKIEGSVPVSLASSPSLEYIFLENNNLVGSIPSSFCIGSPIKYLELTGNYLSGSIPSSLGNCSSLIFLYLHKNNLTGTLPPFSPLKSSLKYLSLYSNYFSGNLPPSLGNNSHLFGLYLSENNFNGTIPESLGTLPKLLELDLSMNSLIGEIPYSIYNLSLLTHLGLGNNYLTGTIPQNISLALPNIKNIIVPSNKFEGPIPSSLCNASRLEIIDFSNNSFNGLVPSNLGSLQNLREVDIGGNKLEAHDWIFLSSLTNCSLLEKLSFENNKIKGTLPNFIGNLSTNLQWLLVGNNDLSGPVPQEIGNLIGLTLLYMDQGSLKGNIPSTIGKLHNLIKLNLSKNRFSGSCPSSIGNLTQLSELHMEENKLGAIIPSSFGNCKTLSLLNLSHNSFTGNIPNELLSLFSLTQTLDLSYNLLNGPLPEEVGILINLGHLDISNNNLSHEIPLTIGQCVLLEYLYIDGNFFEGKIPPTMASLRSAKVLDLSRNKLTGPIPDFFTSFDALQFINLSFNNLEGKVPDDDFFKNSTMFSIFGNEKLCGGLKALKLPACINRTVRKLPNLLRVIISIGAFICLVCALVAILQLRRKKTNAPFSLTRDKFKMITYRDIAKATNWFSPDNLVGLGSSGLVYEGKLDHEETHIAVKIFNLQHSRALRSFNAECEALRKLRHRNILKAITSCSTLDSMGNEFKALIFEYMHNGSLEELLHPKDYGQVKVRRLNLAQRVSIIAEVAFALNYLHHECASPVVHCDLKPSNILLDGEMTAHVSDFGLARFLSDSDLISCIDELKGSIGYVAPEYGVGSPISTLGDVYSYGILLLEMFTGKKPTDDMFKDGLSLHKLVETAFPDELAEVLDPSMFQIENEGCSSGQFEMKNISHTRLEKSIVPIVKIGLMCSMDSPRERTDIKQVINEIFAIKKAAEC